MNSPMFRLAYKKDPKGNQVPDSSNAGYGGGGVALPVVPTKMTLGPMPSGDDGARIPAALDAVGALPADANGIRGALLLQKGTYRIGGVIVITKSGVVLRGEGQGTDGTVLLATGAVQRSLVEVKGSGGLAEVTGTRRPITDDYVPVGAHTFHVDNASGFKVGDSVVVQRPLDPGVDRPRGHGRLRGRGNQLRHRRRRRHHLPRRPVDARLEGPELRSSGHRRQRQRHHHRRARRQRAGEDLRRRLDLQVHGGRPHLAGGHREPARRQRVRQRHRRDAAQLVLFRRSTSVKGRHDFVEGSNVPGPNVFLDSKAINSYNDSGPHHRWSAGGLFDNITSSKQINVRNRGNSGSGHGWAGANMVVWNSTAGSMLIENPPGTQNWAIGCKGTQTGNGLRDSTGPPVWPRSLYLQQLLDRAGPAAVQAIAH